jgi:hypothetical protein
LKLRTLFVIIWPTLGGELAQEWRNHEFSYNENSEISEKSKHALWKASRNSRSTFGSIKKIHYAIEQTLCTETVDLNHILGVIQLLVISKPLDGLVFSCFGKLRS